MPNNEEQTVFLSARASVQFVLLYSTPTGVDAVPRPSAPMNFCVPTPAANASYGSGSDTGPTPDHQFVVGLAAFHKQLTPL